jgi:hypothetical protein
MRRTVVAVLSGTALVGIGAYALWPRSSAEPVAAAQTTKSAAALPDAERLELRELLDPGPVLKPSAKATSLTGKRVRMVGFMAQMELPPKGGFYLVPRPLHADEAGGGTADLPPQSVLVVSRSTAGQTVPFIRGALEVTGILELGNRADADGRVSAIRLILDGAPLSNPRGEP